MTPDSLLSVLLTVLAFLLLLALIATISRLTRGISRDRSEGDDEAQVPTGAFEALRFAIAHTTKNTSLGDESISLARTTAALSRSSMLEPLGIINSYLAFSGDADDNALSRLADLLRESGEEEAQTGYHLYSRLVALRKDLAEENFELPTVRHLARLYTRSSSEGQEDDWLATGLSALVGAVDRLAELALETMGSATDSAQGQGSEALEANRKNLRDLHMYLQSIDSGRFAGERATIQQAVASLLRNAPEAQPDTPAIEHVADIPLQVLPSCVTIPYRPNNESAPLVVRLPLTLANSENEDFDSISIRWSLRPSSSGGSSDQCEGAIKIGVLGGRKSIDLDLHKANFTPLPEGSVTTVEFNLGYESADGIRHAGETQIDLKWASAWKIKSPYAVRAKASATYFVGREATLNRLLKVAQSEEPKVPVLFGLPSVGKTALLYEIKDRCEDPNSDWDGILAAYTSLDETRFSGDDWPGQIFENLRMEIRRLLPALDAHRYRREEAPRNDEPFLLFDEFVSRTERILEANNLRLVLMIDEYHRIEDMLKDSTNQRQTVKKDFVLFLKSLSQKYPRLTVILSGFYDLTWMSRTRSGAVWLEALGKTQLGLGLSFLRRDEATELIREPMRQFALRYSDDVADLFFRATHGYPILIHAIGERLFERVLSRFVDRKRYPDGSDLTVATQDWDIVVRRFLKNEARSQFERIWIAGMEAGDRAVCVALAKGVRHGRADDYGWTRRSEIEQLFARETNLRKEKVLTRLGDLTERGVITVEENSRGQVLLRLSIPLMEDWLGRYGDFRTELAGIGALKEQE